ncbi:conserved exported protein of unknown function [Magnetospirillum sp. XM-1]|uniref:hypothetical protein n=1 Tax=Magnetospirillum sp. XM-1 TaxID=1663591 RepID=UPI00073DEA55|nr:hypothetical protein [Magnetospirillum sp. XM-1]CUW37698.1 conserved exported protein of unknown function [Magnetospirillum sp. XM-1]
MRPLGLLGAAFSGAPPFAGLGAGIPDATKFLRGDGAWSPLASFANSQIITSSGTFTVPAGVTLLAVNVIGGGGGSGYTNGSGTPGGNGGSSSFGSYAVAPGGGGGATYSGSGPTLTASGSGTPPAYVVGAGVFGMGTGVEAPSDCNKPTTYGQGDTYAPWSSLMKGNNGAVAIALIPVTPGQQITVTIGAGGTGSVGGSAGAVIVRY